MIFTKPCCDRMKRALAWGSNPEDRAIHLAGDGFGPLFVRVGSAEYRACEGPEKQWCELPVLFCPFCGTRLQTDEERWVVVKLSVQPSACTGRGERVLFRFRGYLRHTSEAARWAAS